MIIIFTPPEIYCDPKNEVYSAVTATILLFVVSVNIPDAENDKNQ